MTAVKVLIPANAHLWDLIGNFMKHKAEHKTIGVWMDHSEAHLIEPDKGHVKHFLSPAVSHVHHSGESVVRLGNHRSTNNEHSMHERDQTLLHSYYKELAVLLHPYDEIYVFGPTTARSEFANYVEKQRLLAGKKLSTHSADKMTEPQMVAFVKQYFDK